MWRPTCLELLELLVPESAGLGGATKSVGKSCHGRRRLLSFVYTMTFQEQAPLVPSCLSQLNAICYAAAPAEQCVDGHEYKAAACAAER